MHKFSDPNYICSSGRKLICPKGCLLNIRGDMCINNGQFNIICNKTNIPQCPNNCYYDENAKICKQTSSFRLNEYDVCEPVITLGCIHDTYTVDRSKYPPCQANLYDICFTVAGTIRYPLRLKNKYSGIMCKYSSYGNCEIKRIVRICCN